MNHWQLVDVNKDKVVEIWEGRKVRVIGASVPGSFFCEAVDGLKPIYEASTAFLDAPEIH